MSGDRVILAVKYTPSASPKELRRAVGGFLRYVQYRDKHPDSEPVPTEVSGLLKYVAYRDRAAPAGRLFGPEGPVGDQERRDFAVFVARSLGATRPQRNATDSGYVDRRRAVYRFVLSPENAAGLDLSQLTRVAVDRLEREAGVTGLRWIAAEHRNTAHPHVHLVLAGMREPSPGSYRGFIVTPKRLAAMKEELALEIARQRAAARVISPQQTSPTLPAKPSTRRLRTASRPRRPRLQIGHASVFMRLQLAAQRYRRQIEQEALEDRRERERERAWSR